MLEIYRHGRMGLFQARPKIVQVLLYFGPSPSRGPRRQAQTRSIYILSPKAYGRPGPLTALISASWSTRIRVPRRHLLPRATLYKYPQSVFKQPKPPKRVLERTSSRRSHLLPARISNLTALLQRFPALASSASQEIKSINDNPQQTIGSSWMENKGLEAVMKRKRTTEKLADADPEEVVEEETEANVAGSEEMEMNISHVLERIERFTQQVSELLEAGKTMFKDLSAEFEERMVSIHREQIEKWQDEIKELRMLDASNEQASNRLHNARYLLQNVHMNS
ncbi:uncharacterized protein LOC131224691 isoform X2 [Magnolia sinica]|uniref:uncharacterized protein LOC131224691 isoform X2 n=1 Tax=Magnolia sinica TaxID=86752 RepID=UPI00265A7A96|nr:uncharacterized protein LOC131224691 isoform X2 [Magnolia sinica]